MSFISNKNFKDSKTFPEEEKYRLTDQLIRAERSVTANLVEGFGRFHYPGKSQFCRQGRGSLTVTPDHLICAFDENYVCDIQLNEFRAQYEKCLKLIKGYISFL